MTDIERENCESRIRALISMLDAPTSPIGDWKIIKIYEARLNNLVDPYDYEELKTERQKVREEINFLQEKLNS